MNIIHITEDYKLIYLRIIYLSAYLMVKMVYIVFSLIHSYFLYRALAPHPLPVRV